MKYVIGLDIGIASVGWSAVDLDRKRILDLGVRAFSEAENHKTGAPLAEPRRLARGARRRLARRAERLRRTKQLFVDYALIKPQEIESAFITRDLVTPWDLRLTALECILAPKELARALFHIVKHRGFKSNKKSDTSTSKDDTVMLGSIKQNQELLECSGYRSVGELVSKHEAFADRKRNTSGSYTRTFGRDMLENEIKVLLARQRELGSRVATQEMQDKLVEIFNYQKSFASGDDVLKKIGKCRFEPQEIRAPKRSYTVERFDLLHSINTRLRWSVNGKQEVVVDGQVQLVMDEAYKVEELTFAKIRKILKLSEDARFDFLRYRSKTSGVTEEEIVKSVEKTRFFSMVGYHSIRKACESDGIWDMVKDLPEVLDHIAYTLTIYKYEPEIREYLSYVGVPDVVVDTVVKCVEFSKTSNLSLKAIRNIIPFMEQGQPYHEACESAGYNHALHSQISNKSLKLPAIDPDDVRNPVVLRALSQARKVINALVDRYGSPWRIHIELARDMGRSAEKRREIEREQGENLKLRERLVNEFKENFGSDREPNGTDLLKFRLYREQHGKSMYSLKPIDLNQLLEHNYVEVDHILPRSRSFDDSRDNKVLVFSTENQNKGNKTPYESLSSDQKLWTEIEAYAKTIYLSPGKRNRLLRKDFSESAESEWRTRNLNDTRYITRFISDFIKEHLEFSEKQNKQSVVCLNGQLVAKARWLWGLEKDREKDDLHHALDATVIAVLLPHNQENLTRYFQVSETHKAYVDTVTGEVIEADRPKLPFPWKQFRHELVARLSGEPAERLAGLELPAYTPEEIKKIKPVLVSRMPMRKTKGQIHEDTVRSAKRVESDGISSVRKLLTSLTVEDMKNLAYPDANKELYAEIRKRMVDYGNKADKAFAEPLYKPSIKNAPLVRSVTVTQTQKTGVSIRGGLADNGGMARTDVFRKNGKFYLVPVYIKDMQAGCLPNRAIIAHKQEEQWLTVDEQYEFITSLYPYDLFHLEVGDSLGLFYYRGCHRANGAIMFSPTNINLPKPETKGVQTAILLQRYEMGILGDYHPVRKKEVRRGMENCGNHKRRQYQIIQ